MPETNFRKLNLLFVFAIVFSILFVLNCMSFVSATVYISEIYFTVPDTVYVTNERIELKGYIYQANYSTNGSLAANSTALSGASVNLSMRNSLGVYVSNYTFTTDSNGAFYSKSNFYPSATEVNASSSADKHYIRTEYKDPNNTTWFSEVQIEVVNQSVDMLSVSPNKAKYSPYENVTINVEAIKLIGDRRLYVSNVSVNGSLRTSNKDLISSFQCTTGINGKCLASLLAPSTYGDYILELNNFKISSAFLVSPFSANVYMKDELGKSLKNVFAVGEQGIIEVEVTNASQDDVYTFSGYIYDSSGNNVKTVDSTELKINNSFSNSFLFTVDALTFSYGAYNVRLTITKTGGGSINSTASFEVKDWSMSINKRASSSGFEYEYSIFLNKTMRFEAYPKYRSNGSLIQNISSSYFDVNLTDNLGNVISVNNVTWNSSCGKEGCYEFNLTSPINTGKYAIYFTLSNSGDTQTESQTINVINTIMSAQSTDKDGNIKELFGTNEYMYISLTSYNLTSTQVNLTNAEIFLVSYMNGTEFSYTQASNFSLVNSSNSAYEWAWNSSSQMIKLDSPKLGGLYDVFIFGNNRTVGTNTKFIINPYDACAVTKDTAGTVGSGNYYVWQFKTSDTVYFEIKLTQANNPTGRAAASNNSGNGSSTYGMGGACSIDTTTKQVVSNATLSVLESKNLESGAIQNINSSASTCQSSDSSGGYTCTVKPLSKWDGGVNIVKFKVLGQDGTESIIYSRFESRAFYLYGWSNVWQNSPDSNLTLNVRLYEAGNNWWGNSGISGGISGTITLKKIEYQGRDGEWIWPPVSYNYNVSNVSSSTITSGTGTISIPVSNAPGGVWKTGYYRAVVQGTTSAGDTDYGYAWFGVKSWDVYGQPVECTSTTCNYKNYFNSKENISLFIKISKAGDYSYSYQGGQSLGGNVTVSIKKIQDCRTWPCKELNSSLYNASSIIVNVSSPWYWNANSSYSNYIININSTTGTWGSGYYSVTLDVNGTDSGYAWFNTIAFYVETQPTNSSGIDYKYSIRGNSPMYFNVTTTKSYKWWSGSVRYNESDYVNTTLQDIVLRTWNQQTWTQKEYNYPEDLNVSPRNISGNGLLNLTFVNGTWPTGYYWGELTLKNSDNESSTGWMWFNVQPFRVQLSSTSYSIDTDQCVNVSLGIYDPDWYLPNFYYGNYSMLSVTEDIWGYNTKTVINYTNYTSDSFNATTYVLLCPNNGEWTTGSWGGYHYLNVLVKDNVYNDTQSGWLSFRTLPFQISWGSVVGGTSKATNENVIVPITVTKPSTGANSTGNLTRIYQWRYDNYVSTLQEYVFSVGNCYSNVSSGGCMVNGTQNVTIYYPSVGWKVGYNYLYAEWSKYNDKSSKVSDWGGVYFEGREVYNGYFESADENGYWKHDFANNTNLTIRLYVRSLNYNSVDANITKVEYAFSGQSCFDDWCRTYVSATSSPNSTTNGNAILKIQYPGEGWQKGNYAIRATVSGVNGTAIIKGGTVKVKDFTPPVITLNSPVNNWTYTTNFSLLLLNESLNLSISRLKFSAATDKDTQCYVSFANYDNFYNWYCAGWNITNASNGSSMSERSRGACNITRYNYTGSTYYAGWVSNNYYSVYTNNFSEWQSGSFLTTGGRYHNYTFNTYNWTSQHYGMYINCFDSDYNYVSALSAFKVTT